ncbi:MAG: lantibiotic dehydratase family protein [Bacteroidota bacterium]
MTKRTSYEAYPWFTLRAPLLSVETLNRIPSAIQDIEGFLRKTYNDPIIREAVVLGSYEFSRLIDKAFSNEKQPPDRELLLSLLRYLIRLSSRCTPFGTFAGFSTGKTGNETDIRLSGSRNHRLHVRPDMEYLMCVARYFISDPAIRSILCFAPNSSLYRVGDRWHYIEIQMVPGVRSKIYDVVTVDDNGILCGLLEYCASGKKLAEIHKYLEHLGYNEPEISAFADSLIKSQVLISELEPVVSGPEYLDSIVKISKRIKPGNLSAESLILLNRSIKEINHPGSLLPQREHLSSLARTIPVEVSENHLIQADMKLGTEQIILSRDLANQVLLGIRIVRALSSATPADPLKGFREAFRRRYGERSVQLVKVLDPETGIGLEGNNENYWTDPVPWIDDLLWRPGLNPSVYQGNPGNPWLAGRLFDILASGDLYLELTSQDLQSLNLHDGEWPYQVWAFSELFTDPVMGDAAVHLIHGAGGHPAFLLGRFGFADPSHTMEWVKELIRDEQETNPDSIYAEVVHLPEDRTGNILQRPFSYDYEIPYLARSEKPAENQIPVTDLLVSIAGKRIVLTSATTGKKIEPRMTNAYNHSLGKLSLYKFLHRYQLQDPDPVWRPSWGEAARQAPFIPGIRFKNLILSAPVWTFHPADLKQWIRPDKGETDTCSLIHWKNQRKMPDRMLWMSGDLELFFDWNHPGLVLAFWEVIHNLNSVRVCPFYQADTPVTGPGGAFANQIILCYKQI